MTEEKFKKLILIDLDGVLNTYTGNFDKDFIPAMKDGAKEFLERASKRFEFRLFTTRNRLLSSKWLIDNGLDKFITDVTNIKEPCYLYIDDRCYKFKGSYVELEKEINDFKAWHKKA